MEKPKQPSSRTRDEWKRDSVQAVAAKRDEPLQRAILAAGSVAALAASLGIKPQAVSAWDRCPAERARDVEKATGIPRHELRPDLWDDPTA